MFGVVRKKPIGTTRDRGEQHRNIRRMTNQMAGRLNLRLTWIGHDLRLHQRDQTGIVTQGPVRIAGFNPAQADQEVLLNLLAHGFSENQPANPSCAQREDSFIQPPG